MTVAPFENKKLNQNPLFIDMRHMKSVENVLQQSKIEENKDESR